MTQSKPSTGNAVRPDVCDSKPRTRVAKDEDRALHAASRIRGRRERLQGAPFAELVATIHEGHRH